MSDMEVQPDPIIRTALQRLPIPAHGDDFWARLNDVLDAEVEAPLDGRRVVVPAPEPAMADVAAPEAAEVEPDPALALVPQALRRPSNGVLLAVAAAAAVVVILAGTTLLEERSGTTGEPTDQLAQADPDLDAQGDDAQPETAAFTALSEEGEDASSDAVLAWVDDLGSGDGERAWAAMGAASQAHFGSQDAFEAEMSALREDYGSWAEAAPEDVLVTPVQEDEDGTTIAVVTLVGAVEEEGTTERRAEAFPVRVTDDEAVLEPFALAGAIEMVVPELPTTDEDPAPVGPDDALVIVVPSDAEAPILRVDDGEPVVCGQADGSELTDLEDTPGQRCSYLPPEDLEPGEHTLTMAFLGSDGSSISAESTLFEAA